ncbi:unnamed protein product [Pieris macdunnoughi]|uniref:Reverse transcriptase Ty1/copia-type domain-containing protein n=1 Tax=Pieris macdunnoughi TaxID=345717 RepID=A0A821W7V7_9NEOP|nr:unnamed protein product [Pieris macdunnoughi]
MHIYQKKEERNGIRKRASERAEKGLMVGYGEDIKGYRIYFSEKNTVDTKRDVVFLEQEKNKKGEPIIMFDSKEENNGGEESQTTSEVTPTNFDEDSCEITMCESVSVSEYQPCSDEETSSEETTPVLNERSKRVLKQTSFYKCNNVYSEESEPVTYKDAMSRKDASKWSEAIDKELQTLKANNTWDYCDAPVNTKVVSSKWVFKLKGVSSVKQYKARLVARGFEQEDVFDYYDIYAPVARLSTFRVFVVIATKLNKPIYQMDVTGAFLYGEITEDVYIRLPEGRLPFLVTII